ncbi:hypothetical protein [Saliniradius amylolyticus]|uniref:hypothetical protein n=1 Tax=Saliniradius amylolyticus TaxID=2183582 RepID=UPI000D695DC6|nr:hypothetical protein [Saliniradius amylolyticus]
MISIFITAILVGFVFLELGYLIIKRFKISGLIFFAIFVFISLYYYAYFFEASDYGRENRASMLLVVNAIVYSVPLVIMFSIIVFSKKKPDNIQHIIAAISSMLLGLLFPVFALLTACSVGADCL